MKNVKKASRPESATSLDYALLNRITSRAFYLALEMIHAANSRPDVEGDKTEPKVGGHPSACASSQHILAAIHLVLKKPEDYMANKPHVSPIDHALNYLLHLFREKDGSWMPEDRMRTAMKHLRHYSNEGLPVFQSYHAEADPDNHRFFPSGSVGIPPVNALYLALAYDYAWYHKFDIDEDPTFWCLMGDSEFREGSLHEAMPDAGERELKRLVWVVDYNRQNLDGTRISNEKAFGGSDADRIVSLADANGWRGVKLKHGKLREKLFSEPGGEEFRRVLDEEFTDFEFQALITANNAELIVKRLGLKSPKLKAWMEKRPVQEIRDAFFNVAGHDLQTLIEAFSEAKNSEKPTLIVAYTIKGYGLECQAMSGNHSAMPERAELDEMAKKLGVPSDDPFAEFAKGTAESDYLEGRGKAMRTGIEKLYQDINSRREGWQKKAASLDWPVDFDIQALKYAPTAHTQWMWGQIAAKLDRLARGEGPASDSKAAKGSGTAYDSFSKLFLTMAPDVGSSTNTSPNMNGKLFGDIEQEDFEAMFNTKDKKAPDMMPHMSERSGHLRFEIAEGNCMSAAGSFGKFGYFVGIPFYPAMTIYDFFIKRALDQLYYNCYWKSSFATIGTPSGVTLAAEGAQHSWKSDIQIPNEITWEPCFAKELEWILADTLRRHFTGEDSDREAALIRCVTKGIVQKELLIRAKQQARFKTDATDLSWENADGETVSESDIMEAIRKDTLEGGYALIDYRGYKEYVPGDNVVHLFAMGALVPEAIKASDRLRKEQGICANVFIVTSPDLLLGNFAYHQEYRHLREGLGVNGNTHFNPGKGSNVSSVADWYSLQGSRVPVVSVHDGEPGLLDNIGSIVGVRHRALGIRKTSKSGTTWDIYHLHGIDAEGIVAGAIDALKDASEDMFEVSPQVLEAVKAKGQEPLRYPLPGSYSLQ